MRVHPINNLVTFEDAVTTIEYALLGSLIAIVILSAVALVGSKTLGLWDMVSRCVEAAASSVGSCP